MQLLKSKSLVIGLLVCIVFAIVYFVFLIKFPAAGKSSLFVTKQLKVNNYSDEIEAEIKSLDMEMKSLKAEEFTDNKLQVD